MNDNTSTDDSARWLDPDIESIDRAEPASDERAPEERPDSAGDDREPEATSDPWSDDGSPVTVRLAQIAFVVAVLIGVTAIIAVKNSNDDAPSSAADRPSVTLSSPPDGGSTNQSRDWPANLAGRPPTLGERGQGAADVKATAVPGVYIWNDYDGWHLWVVGGGRMPVSVSGTLTSSHKLAKAIPAVRGVGTVEVNEAGASFDLPAKAALSGVDFNPGFYAERLAIAVVGPDGPLDPTLVHVGPKSVPGKFPLVFDKAPRG